MIGTGDQSQMLSRLVSRVASLDTALAEGEMRRRALHNQLVELRGNVRCQPSTALQFEVLWLILVCGAQQLRDLLQKLWHM